MEMMRMKNIPFSPPFIDEEVKVEVMDALESGWLTTGPKVNALEKEITLFCRAESALGVSSATAGMQLLLHWLGIKEGDEVIVPAYTYCATAFAAIHAGATIKMVDVQQDFTIDINAIEAAITIKTKAIILVDIAGWPCDYDAVYTLLQKKSVQDLYTTETEVQRKLGRIFILADAAHSLGAVYKNRRTGTLADATVFSFHAAKNITTAEGGMICLNMPPPINNAEVYKTLRLWTLNGQTKDALSKSNTGDWQYDVVYPGFKINLPDVLAAIGLAQFRKYKKVLAQRRRVCNTYDAAFQQYEWAICPPFHKQDCESSYHLYPLRIHGINEQQRNEIIEYVKKTGVSLNVHFKPLPMLTVFKQQSFNIADYPVSYTLYSNEISLPVYPQLKQEICEYIIQVIVSAVDQILYEKR
jgi:dTDP-4-amino-4,6-dideoxygalactose transaminase